MQLHQDFLERGLLTPRHLMTIEAVARARTRKRRSKSVGMGHCQDDEAGV